MARPRQLLVVDDDRAMREMLSSLFTERGLCVEEACSADAALARAAELDFDVVLSDVRMPDISGVELVGQLHRLRPRTPVVLMTAFGSIASAVDAMRSGAFDYLTKPFEPEVVILAVERALALSEAETLAPDDVPLPGAPAAPAALASEDFLRAAAARGLTLHELEELYTEQVLAHTGGNKLQAARILGIDRKTLYRRAEREVRHAAGQEKED